MKITEEETQERRKKIVLTAFHLFCEQGIESVTMIHVAKAAGVGESTVYRYFDNKITLVLEAFLKLWNLIMRNLEKSVESWGNYPELTGYEQIKVWIEAFRQLYLSSSDFVLFSYEAKLYLLRHNVKINPLQQDSLMQAIRGPCLLALEKGKADGSIPIKEQNSEDIFYAIWGSIRGYIVKIVMYGELYGEDSPWESRYKTMEKGMLCALSSGWKV